MIFTKSFVSLLFLLIFMLFPLSRVNAKVEADYWTICHATNDTLDPYISIAIDKNTVGGSLVWDSHLGEHVDDIFYEGEEVQCPGHTPVVPEFGLMTGAMALITSGGAFLYMKKGAA